VSPGGSVSLCGGGVVEYCGVFRRRGRGSSRVCVACGCVSWVYTGGPSSWGVGSYNFESSEGRVSECVSCVCVGLCAHQTGSEWFPLGRGRTISSPGVSRMCQTRNVTESARNETTRNDENRPESDPTETDCARSHHITYALLSPASCHMRRIFEGSA